MASSSEGPNGGERIVVAFDGSPPSVYAMRLACERAKKLSGTVCAVYVVEIKRSLPLDVETDAEATKGKAVLAQAQGLAQEIDCLGEVALRRARGVGQGIVEEARARNAQLIVLGIGYKEKLGSFDLGEAAPYVLKKAPCWVWLCRQPQPQ